jgi:hypothetical protein
MLARQRQREAAKFWWIVLALIVIGFALAWWTSGRSRGAQNQGDPHRRWTDEGKGHGAG